MDLVWGWGRRSLAHAMVVCRTRFHCLRVYSFSLPPFPFTPIFKGRYFRANSIIKRTLNLASLNRICLSCHHSECACRYSHGWWFLELAWAMQLCLGQWGHLTRAHRAFWCMVGKRPQAWALPFLRILPTTAAPHSSASIVPQGSHHFALDRLSLLSNFSLLPPFHHHLLTLNSPGSKVTEEQKSIYDLL